MISILFYSPICSAALLDNGRLPFSPSTAAMPGNIEAKQSFPIFIPSATEQSQPPLFVPPSLAPGMWSTRNKPPEANSGYQHVIIQKSRAPPASGEPADVIDRESNKTERDATSRNVGETLPGHDKHYRACSPAKLPIWGSYSRALGYPPLCNAEVRLFNICYVLSFLPSCCVPQFHPISVAEDC